MTEKTQERDPELVAMSSVFDALSPLNQEAQERVLGWVASKLGLNGVSRRDSRDAANLQTSPPAREGTINTVCSRLGVKSCRDLFKAAAFHLSLYQGKDRFSRSEWVACAKEAKHWKADYSMQMATQITRLHDAGFVNETAKDVYSVPDEELNAFDALIRN